MAPMNQAFTPEGGRARAARQYTQSSHQVGMATRCHQCGHHTAPHVDGKCRECCQIFCDGCYGEADAPMCRDCTAASAAKTEHDEPAGAPLFYGRFCQQCRMIPEDSARDFTICATCRRWYCGQCFGPEQMICYCCWNNLRDDPRSKIKCTHASRATQESQRCSGCTRSMQWCCHTHSQFVCGSCRCMQEPDGVW